MNKKFYITAAIPYVNGVPHIGHALEFVQCDTISRYKKLTGCDTLFVSGSDENGLKIVQAAENQQLTPQQLADNNTQVFQDFVKLLNVDIDVWRRGSDEKLHWPGTEKLWKLCHGSGDIYKKKWGGYYCVGCEDFYTQKDLIDGKCPEHLTKPDWVEEENYFFRLSKYQKKIEELITTNVLNIFPQIRKNEVLSFIKNGLDDFSISRSKKRAKNWGIPVPGDSTQVVYTWYDALNVYQTAVGFGYDEKLWKKWWPADVHVIGKGILRFHAIYWIGMLLSAKLPLPKSIFAHGYISSGGQKMSKSLGNVVDPFAVVKKYGVDATRYYLLREIPAYGDGDFTYKRFEELYNSDLASGLGNVVSRIAKLCETSEFEFNETDIPIHLYSETIRNVINDFQFDVVLSNLWQVELSIIDQHIDQNQPWSIKDKSKKREILQEEVDLLRIFIHKIKPFLPLTSEKILKQFAGPKIKSQPPLFPRIT